MPGGQETCVRRNDDFSVIFDKMKIEDISGRIKKEVWITMKAIGIDIGTTTISGVVLGVAKRQVLEARTVQNGSFIKTEHEWERIQDVDVILDKAADLVKELLACCPEAGAIGLTGQMHGIVYLDRKGRHISPLYTWQDGRGNLSSDGHKPLTEQVMDKTGVFIASGYGLISHLYNLRNGLVPQEAVSLCTIGDYLGMVLTGKKVSPGAYKQRGESWVL